MPKTAQPSPQNAAQLFETQLRVRPEVIAEIRLYSKFLESTTAPSVISEALKNVRKLLSNAAFLAWKESQAKEKPAAKNGAVPTETAPEGGSAGA